MARAAQAETRQEKDDHPPIWEEVAGLIGLALLLAVVGFLVYEALQPRTPPAVIVSAVTTTATQGGWLVTLRVENRGETTAAGVNVEGRLLDPADPAGEPAETSSVTLDYVPELSERRAGLYFAANPAEYRLELRAEGYVNP